MAKDLIPPPSPAGRPASDAEAERERAREREEAKRRQGGLWSRSAAADPVADAAEMGAAASESAPPPRVDSPYRSRFGVVLGALVGIAIATLAIGAAVYVGSGGNGAPDGWSKWKPQSEDGLSAAREIAEHVGQKYRESDNSQLVGVAASPLEIELDALGVKLPLDIALKTASQGGDIKFIEGNGVMYTLNGLGPEGALGGKPSAERAMVLRREALELVLYTFRYVDDVDLVVTLLPPATLKPKTPPKKGSAAAKAPAQKQPQALFFRPGDLEPQLEIPLAATIPQEQTPRPDTLKDSEALRIDTLTSGNLFGWSYQHAQNQKAYLVLERLAR